MNNIQRESIINVQNLTHVYSGNDIPVFDNISFEIRRGEFIGIIGDNGTGKSTLIKLLLGQIRPQKGTITVFNSPPYNHADWGKIGYVSQNSFEEIRSIPSSVHEVLYSRFVGFSYDRSFKNMRMESVIDLFDLQHLRYKSLSELSGGQRQKVMIARSLLLEPQILFLDEPNSALDMKSQSILHSHLEEMNAQGVTILLITHDTDTIKDKTTRLLCLKDCDKSLNNTIHLHTSVPI